MSATLWNSVLYVPFLWVDNRISSQCFSTFFFLFYTDSFPWRILTSLQQYKVNVLLREKIGNTGNWKKRDTVSLTFKQSGHPNYKNIHFPPSFVTTVQINRAVKLLQMLTSVSESCLRSQHKWKQKEFCLSCSQRWKIPFQKLILSQCHSYFG